MGRRLQVTRIVVDVLCLIAVYVPWLCIIYFPQPYHRGFFCGDESIAHPYKDSTVSTLVLTVVGVGLPIITILIVEGIHVSNNKKRRIPNPPFYVGDKSYPTFVYRCYKIIGCFLFGLAVTMVITDTAKYCVGRLRPHFLDVCKPDYSKISCVDERGFQVYITEDVCTGTHRRALKESRLSFPSGHASISIYCMLFAGMYLHGRFTWKGSKLLCPLMEFVYFSLAFFTCLSRISDYKHHWSDVLSGAAIGIFTACVTVIHLSKLLPVRRAKNLPSSVEDLNQVKVTAYRQASKVTYLTDDPTSSQISVTSASQETFPGYGGASCHGNNNIPPEGRLEHPDFHGHGNQVESNKYNVQL